MTKEVTAYNESRGIENITTARSGLIHGGGQPWMWGWAVLHATESVNRMKPPSPILGHAGKSRLQISDPSVTAEKEMRNHKPFLCLGFKTPLLPVRARKAYAVLTVPNLYLEYTIELRFVNMAFLLRKTYYLSNQLDTFLRLTSEDDLYQTIHGPANLFRRNRLDGAVSDRAIFVEQAPTAVRTPVAVASLPGPCWSSSRGYTPSEEGLRSVASVRVTAPRSKDVIPTYTPDQLATRFPRTAKETLAGPDAAYWLSSIKRDFAIISDNDCLINITETRSTGRAPPSVEQRFKIESCNEDPIALDDIAAKDWKTRTIVRGDRFKAGVDFGEAAAPVVHSPAVMMLIAYAVQKGLFIYSWDVESAFYLNLKDRSGVIVQLTAGYDPYSTDIWPFHLLLLYAELAKALPGIPQGSFLHYNELSPALQKLNLQPVDADNCLFVHPTLDIATTIHVDDGLLVAPTIADAESILGSKGLGGFRNTTWGPLKALLGCNFDISYTPERRIVFMSQRKYANTILERADMQDCKPAPTPARPGQLYTKADCPTNDTERAALATPSQHPRSIWSRSPAQICS
jgi:hypothetical protein